ncbi:hypothetical protein LguiB_024072 [Lonicera macranthoides]
MANLIINTLVFHLPHQFLPAIQQLQKKPIIRHKRFLSTYSDSEPLNVCVAAHASSSSSLSLSSFTVKYLTNSCGLSLQEAFSASKKYQLDELKLQKYESVLSLLRSFQFSDTHIKKLLIKFPYILRFRLHTNLKPKLEYLTEIGFVSTLLPELILLNPDILLRSLSGYLKPSMKILRKYVKTNEKVVAAVKHWTCLSSCDMKGILQPNVEFLLSEGVPRTTIENLIVWHSRTLIVKLDKFVTIVEILKKLGFKPTSTTFIVALRCLVSVSDSTSERKVQLFKSWGWSEEQIVSAFKRDPLSLAGSEEKIRSIMDFYVNTMKLNPADIAAYPTVLRFSLNTRTRPRYNVIKVLVSKNLIKKPKKLVWISALTEKEFLKRFVDKHLDQVPNLMEIYRGTITGDKIDIKLH